MRRAARYMGGNAGTEGPTSCLFFDTESKKPEPLKDGSGFTLSLRLWCASYCRREGQEWTRERTFDGTTPAEFWALVESLCDWKRPLWVFAHNLGFDLTELHFWRELESRRFTAGPVPRPPGPKSGKARRPWMGRLVLEGRPTFLVLRCKSGIVRLVDSGNYWPGSLEGIGEQLGVAKLPLPEWTSHPAKWRERCTRDVEILRTAVTRLISWWVGLGAGQFKMSAAAMSLTSFKHSCDCRAPGTEKPNIVLKPSKSAQALERGAYLGARIEAFYVGKVRAPVWELDVNQCYAHQLEQQLYPRKRVRRLMNPAPEKLLALMRCYGACADVLIDTGPTSRSYPRREVKCQVHASGKFWTTLCGPELLRALEEGDAVKIGEARTYSMAPLFRGWARRWMDRRAAAELAGDELTAGLVKLLLNSLYGKLGQKGARWVDTDERLPRKGWGYTWRIGPRKDQVKRYRYIGGHCQRWKPGPDPADSFPAISAYVTSYAREHIRSAFATMPPRSLLYTATDSVVCLEAGYAALVKAGWIHPKEPGKLRVEQVYTEAEICGPNWYRLGDDWTISGMHGRAKPDADGNPVAEVWDRLPGVLSAKPDGTWTVRLYQLGELTATEKNADAGEGWRRPLHLRPDPKFSDRPPRLIRGPVLPE